MRQAGRTQDGPQRVLMLMQNSTYPGDPRVVQEAEALAAAGHDVTVICPAGTGQSTREERLGDVRIRRYPPPPRAEGPLGYVWEYAYSTAVSLAKAVRLAADRGFDVIHAANPPDTFVLVALAFRPFGKAFVFDHHDLMPEMYGVRFPGRKGNAIRRPLLWLEGLSCRVADRIISVNEAYAATVIERHGVRRDRVTVVRNGPDLGAFDPALPPVGGLAPPGRHVIMYAGSISVQDGVDSLIRAIGHLVHHLGRRDFTCLVLGRGVAVEGLQTLAAELDVAEHIHFVGSVPRDTVPAYLAGADICVAPEPSNAYNDRSTMIKVMEYMAMGKPIVAFDLPEHRFSARDGAVYVPHNDERLFARALADLIDDPVRRATLGAAGRRRVEQELSWGHQVPKLIGVYDALRATPRRRARRSTVGGHTHPIQAAAATVGTMSAAPALELLDVDDARWRSFVESSPAATPFHHPAWTRVLVESYGFRPLVATVAAADGSIEAGMPIVEVGWPARRRRWVSLPFTDSCAPLVRDGSGDSLLQALHAVRRRERLRAIECRGEMPAGPDTYPWLAGLAHRLPIHDDLDRLRAGLGKMHRRNLKTAEKAGVEVRFGRSAADLAAFHRLHVLTRQRLGVPTQPRRFFDALGRFITEDELGFVLSARVDGETVASGVFLAWNGVLVYKFGASDARNWPSRPNNLLFWTAIRWASEHGFHTLDFGRTEVENTGLRQFKVGWGAAEEPLHYTTLATNAPAEPSPGRLQERAGEVIRRSPPWVGEAVGRALYRYTA